METNEIIKKFEEELSKDWQKKEPIGLVSPLFENTFNPSGGHDVVVPTMRESQPKPLLNFYTIERCFRDIDIGIVGISHHLSYFEMSTFGVYGALQGNSEVVKKVIHLMVRLLLQTFELEPKNVFVAYFNGGTIASQKIPPPEEEINIWKETGFHLKLVPITGRRTFIYSGIKDWPAGHSFEIFYDRGEQFPDTIRFIEIASINFYKYLTRSNPNGSKFFEEVCNWAVGGGIGLERLAMILQKAPTIYDIDIFKSLKESFMSYVSDEEFALFRKSYNILLDHLRAVIFILMDGQKIDSTPRGKILRKLMKRIVDQLIYLNLFDKNVEIINKFYDELLSIYEKRFPKLTTNRNEIISDIREFILSKT